MNIWGFFLKKLGWTVDITAPRRKKVVICVAPHTSNWDFIAGLAAYRSLGRQANFLMKKFWFFFPLGLLMRRLGGIPVATRGGKSLVSYMIEQFSTRPYLNLAVTPEGTRSRQPEWHSGFLRIAYGAAVPVQLGVIDFRRKRIEIKEEYQPTGNLDADMARVKAFYALHADAARYPDKFTV